MYESSFRSMDLNEDHAIREKRVIVNTKFRAPSKLMKIENRQSFGLNSDQDRKVYSRHASIEMQEFNDLQAPVNRNSAETGQFNNSRVDTAEANISIDDIVTDIHI